MRTDRHIDRQTDRHSEGQTSTEIEVNKLASNDYDIRKNGTVLTKNKITVRQLSRQKSKIQNK